MGDPNKIFLGGVSFTTTEDTLRNYLEKYGTILDVVIMRDKFTGQSRGFGFATFTEPEAAEKALADTHQIDGRKIEVKKATPRGSGPAGTIPPQNTMPVNEKKIFVGGLAPSVDSTKFKEYFEKYGQVEDAIVMTDRETTRSRGFGFITFANSESVQAAMAETTHELDGKNVEVKSAHAKVSGGGYGRGRGGKGGFGRGGGGGGGSYGRGYGRGGFPGMDPNAMGFNGGRGGQMGYGRGGAQGQGQGQGQYGMYGGYGYGYGGWQQGWGPDGQMQMYQTGMQGYGNGFGYPGGQVNFAQPGQNGAVAGGAGATSSSDWVEMTDQNTQRPYYYHRKTGQTSWTKPEATEGEAGATSAAADAPIAPAAGGESGHVAADASGGADGLADGIAAVSLSS